MSVREPLVYLEHIQDALSRIAEYTAGGREEFFASRVQQDAVLRNLEVIGEAVKQIPEDVRAEAPEIPWRRIAGMRDVLIHQYFGVDLNVVWGVVDAELPRLRDAVGRMIRGRTGG